MSYFFLAVAILGEVTATSALKACDGFTRLGPSAIVVVGYATALLLLSLTLRTIPVGIAYAIWAGCGTALVVLAGTVLYGQTPDRAALIGIGLIIAGVVVIHTGSGCVEH